MTVRRTGKQMSEREHLVGVGSPILTLEELLLKLSLGNLDLNRLIDLLLVAALVIGVVLDGGGEQGVDEGRLSQAGLASNL